MRHSARKYLIRCCLCLILLPLALGRVAAQTPSVALLELKSCGRSLTVFDDRTVVEAFSGGETRRQLSEKQMKKLRKVIASDPCERRLADRARKPASSESWSVKLADRDECFSLVLGYPRGLMEIFVTRHYPDHDRDIVVYVPCGNEKISTYLQQQINAKWKRFIKDVLGALGGKSLIESCQCRKY